VNPDTLKLFDEFLCGEQPSLSLLADADHVAAFSASQDAISDADLERLRFVWDNAGHTSGG
jgi:hypothetical protein